MVVIAFFHVRADTPLSVVEHADENRVVVEIGDGDGQAHLFLRLPDLDRLIRVLSASRDRMACPA